MSSSPPGCTLLHSSLLHVGAGDLLSLLCPSYRAVLHTDFSGRSSAHYIAMSIVGQWRRRNNGMASEEVEREDDDGGGGGGGDERLLLVAPHRWRLDGVMHTLQQLAVTLNGYRFQSDLGDVRGFDAEEDGDEAETAVASASAKAGTKTAINEFKKKLRMSVGSGLMSKSILKSGWLKKRRGGMFWQKRFFVLTEDFFIYYNSEDSMNKPMFAIPLMGCSVKRVPGKENIMEVTSPHMGDKRSIFGSSSKKAFMLCTDTEVELQEWLMPLKVRLNGSYVCMLMCMFMMMRRRVYL
jgi:hypothetical protein